MRKYNLVDFEKMHFDPMVGDVIDAYGLAVYPEFDSVKIEKLYSDSDGDLENYGITDSFVFSANQAAKYVFMAYDPESPLAKISDFQTRKNDSLVLAHVPKKFRNSILENENPMVSDMITRFFRLINNYEYEMIISAKEAISTLLSVVRRPIGRELADEKYKVAVQSKKEAFSDAKYLMGELNALYISMTDTGTDIKEHVEGSVFKAGIAEKLAEAKKKTK